MGCIMVEKLRAICLLEADYNWLLKLIFAKRMMNNARTKGIIPAEQFAKAGTRSSDGTLCKLLTFDRSRILHHTAALTSVDLGNCYDAVAHSIASIAVQAFGVSPIMVKVMLSVMQTMQFFLRSGYGDSTSPFGASKERPYGGLGQGSGAAPSSFSAVSTLMIMAFLRMGHGVQISTAVTGFVFALAAILCADDTDVLH
jgi:hypothetical protein